MTLDDVPADVSTLMTAELLRLFKAAGCSPAKCHACARLLRAGQTFKLVAHNGTDEMCCDRCGLPELIKRDKRAARQPQPPIRHSGWGGFSRPSKA